MNKTNITYSEYMAISAGQKEKEREYWRNRLAGQIVQSSFPYDLRHTGPGEPVMKTGTFQISGPVFSTLMKLSKGSDHTLHVILLSVLTLLVHRYTTHKDIITGTPIFKQKTAADFLNTVLPLRNPIHTRMTFRELLVQAGKTLEEAVKHQNYPIQVLVRDLGLDTTEDQFPLFDIAVLTENIHERSYLDHLRLNMIFSFLREKESLRFRLNYNSLRYNPETCRRLGNHFTNLLNSTVAHIDSPLHTFDMLSEAERRQLLVEFNSSRADFPLEQGVNHFIQTHAEKNPHRIAVGFQHLQLTYLLLRRRVDRLARHLKTHDIRQDQTIGILMHRSPYMLESILAIWQCGGAYIPIDPDYPGERIDYMLRDSNSSFCISDDWEQGRTLEVRPSLPVNASTFRPSGLAYIIYTSGSTGKPKGAMVEHGGMLNHLHAKVSDLQITSESVIVQNASHTFDISVWQFFAALIAGGKTIIYPNSVVMDAPRLISRLVSDRATIFETVPSYLSLLLDYFTGSGDDFPLSLEYLVVTGEEVGPSLVGKWFDKYPRIKMVNAYGPTEASDDITHHIMHRAVERERVPIGKPLWNLNIYILDTTMNLCPIGIKGEICVSGIGVGRGYLNKPELTEKKFEVRTSNFELIPTLYHTGDLGCWLPDGSIEFFGRIDSQVKIRGFRIETGEIENRLLRRSDISEAAVVVKDPGKENKYLCAYLVSAPGVQLDETAVRDDLLGTLPGYMVPEHWIVLEKMPLTPNGKIDRKTLSRETIRPGEEYRPPVNPIEEKLAGIWSQSLGIEKHRISRGADFFRLGGHSLSAILVESKIQKQFNVRVPLTEFFRTPTIRQLAQYIGAASEDRYISIDPVEEREYYLMSPAQKRMYLVRQMEPSSVAYNMPALIPLEAGVKKEKLADVCRQLIRRHESLRTSFHMIREEPVQVVHDGVEFEIEYFGRGGSLCPPLHGDHSDIPRDFIRPFDLEKAPLLRVGLAETEQGKYTLMVDMHHIISDEVSINVLKEDFTALYTGRSLAPPGIRYKDFSQWQHSPAQQENIGNQETYWLRQFDGELPVLQLPVDYPRPEARRFEGSTVTFVLSPLEVQTLDGLAKQARSTLYVPVLAVYTLLLSKLSGQEDIIVGSPTVARRHPDLETVIGMFVNTLALRNYPIGEMPFQEYLTELKYRTLEAFENQEYQFEDLVDKLSMHRDAGRNPVFDVMFNWLNQPGDPGDAPVTEPQDMHTPGTSKFDLNLTAIDRGGHIHCQIEYDTQLFKPGTIDKMIRYSRNILSELSQGVPGLKLSNIRIMSSEEKEQILAMSSGVRELPHPDLTIHRWYEDQSARTPHCIAVSGTGLITPGNQLTYRALNRTSNRLARVLRRKGVSRDSVAGMAVKRSVEMIVGVLAVMKAGGAYLPIDSEYPEVRKEYMMTDSSIRLLLTDDDGGGSIEGVERIDLSNQDLYNGNGDNLKPVNRGSDLVYVIYTSGSTGKPKGAMVEHRNLVNLLDHQFKYTNIDCSRMMQFASFSFDVSVHEIFSALLSGGQLCVIHKDMRIDISRLFRFVKRNDFKTLFLPMSFLKIVFSEEDYIRQFPGCVTHIQTAGEHVVVNDRFRDYLKEYNIHLHNHYGPSETHVATTLTLDPSDEIPGRPSIGKPIMNTAVHILDKAMNLLPTGVVGELHIAGQAVGRGYLNRPGLTAEKFLPVKTYKTGDLARWLPDGNIELLGRLDHQVKIRGFRVEVGEIETRLSNHSQVKEAVVTAGTEANGNKYLCAYIVPMERDTRPGCEELLISGLRDYLSSSMPDYMIPSYFMFLDRVPLTPNGKVDRRALPEPEAGTGHGTIPPGNPVEEKLADLWADVLEIEKDVIGIEDNFFQLGGHSLKATIMISRIHKAFNVNLSLTGVFRNPTIEELARYIHAAAPNPYAAVNPVEKRGYYGLSSAQKRLYIIHQMDPQSIAYNMPQFIPLDDRSPPVEILEETLIKLIHRHESLRTSFHMTGEDLVQVVHDRASFEIEYFGRGGSLCPPLHGDHSDILRDFVRPFDLGKAPLMRVGLSETGEGKHVLMADMHHIISDGISLAVLGRDFTALYEGRTLPPLRIQYKDFSQWQISPSQQENIASQETYWLDEFPGEIPVLRLPTDYPRPVVRSFEGGGFKFQLPSEDCRKLKIIARETGSTLFMVLLTLHVILLSKLSGQEDIVIGTPISGRRHPDLEKIIGVFVNTLPLRNYPNSRKSARFFLKEVKERSLKAFENQEYPFEDLVEQLPVERDTGRSPLFDVMFMLNDINNGSSNADITPVIGEKEPPEFPVDDYEERTAKFDLTIAAAESGENLLFGCQYSAKLFKKETIQRFTAYFKRIVSHIAEAPDIKLSDIEIISTGEKERLLFEFNDTRTDYPKDKSIHQLFEEQSERTPHRIAVTSAASSMTYREFNRQSGRLADHLTRNSVGPGSIVAIMTERSLEMMVGIYGILKAGGAYLPIDPEYPEERIDYMLRDSGASILPDRHPPSSAPLDGAQRGTSPGSLAYIIYTSGSTGAPKGVMIEHHSVVNRLKWMQSAYPIGAADVIMQKTPVIFDVSVWELFWWGWEGARLYLLGPGEEKDPETIADAVGLHNVTTMHFVPSMLNAFLDHLENRIMKRLESLRQVFASGEALQVEQAERFNRLFENLPAPRLINLYGPTEATVDVSYYNCPPDQGIHRIPIGKPIHNTGLYIMDEYLNIQPIGIAGQLCIGGAGLARGYLNRPELTAEKFNHDFKKEKKEISAKSAVNLYKTGDLARWLADGNIEFLGRIDHQVKIRGYRIELGEIESCLVKQDNIKEAVVIDREDERGGRYLCAYIIYDDPSAEPDLRKYLSKQLPDYMAPSFFVRLNEVPLTPSGKIDRKALPAPKFQADADHIAPAGYIESQLARLWSEVLGIDQLIIGIDSHFFALGGHSLNATVIVSKIHQTLNVKVPLAQVFRTPAIRGLANYIKAAAPDRYAAIEPAEKQEHYALSSTQKRLYIIQQMDLESTVYNMPQFFPLEFEHTPPVEKLQETFITLIQRHESLRTSFHMIDNQPVQKVHNNVDFRMELFGKGDPLWSPPHGNMDSARGSHGGQPLQPLRDFVRPFNLSRAPLLQVGLIETGEGNHVLMVDMHHIISDGVSMAVLEQDFAALYEGRSLPPLRIQYKDFSQWQNSRSQRETVANQGTYWLGEFSIREEIPVLQLPADYPRPMVQRFEGGGLKFQLPAEECRGLKVLAGDARATLFMVLLSLTTVLLSKLSGQEDIVIGTPVAGRRHADLEKVIGMFVNTLAMRNSPADRKTAKEFLKEVKEHALKAFENQEYPFEDLVEQLPVERDAGRNPVFDVMFTLNNINPGPTVDSYEPGTAKFDLTIDAVEAGEGLQFQFQYSAALFKKATILRFISHFKRLVSSVLESPNIKLRDIEIISPGEKERLLFDLNDTATNYPKDKTIHELFEQQVSRTPDRTALVWPDSQTTNRRVVFITYKTLNEQADRSAWILTNKGVKPGTIAGLMTERSLEMIVAILAILKSGGAYLPIEMNYPEERIDVMLRDSGACILLLAPWKPPLSIGDFGSVEIMEMPGIFNSPLERGGPPKAGRSKPSKENAGNLAYVIYTSGTTGKPKGVLTTHYNVTRVVLNTNYIELTENDRLLQWSNYAFDGSVFDIYGALLNGGALVLTRAEDIASVDRLAEVITGQAIDIFFITTAFFNLLADLRPRVLDNVRQVLFGGERVSFEHTRLALERSGGGKIIHVYGPTETTVYAAYYPVNDIDERTAAVPIGKALSNTSVYILDKSLRPVPIGVTGEIYIGGPGTARGYLNRPELTVERFIPNPYAEGDRLYKTGDMARWFADGNIEFIGRTDHQVKIRGFRIELREIENQLVRHEHIKEVVVLDMEEQGNDKYLCAYVVPTADKGKNGLETSELKSFLSGSLPDYMIPAYFVPLETLPLTPNGKLDRKALPAVELETGDVSLAPRTPVEVRLAELWSGVLGIPPSAAGIDDNFFVMGGHSLKATVLVSKIHEAFNVNLPLTEVFRTPTIRELAQYIDAAVRERYAAIEPVGKREYYPLSSAQKRLYIIHQMAPENTAYNIPQIINLEIHREFSVEKLEATFIKLIDRHESLRTSFHMIHGQPVQKVHNNVEFEIEFFGRGGSLCPPLDGNHSGIQQDFVHPFDLRKAPLLRVRLNETGKGRYILMVDMHHIISDGVSMTVLENDFTALVEGKPLAPLRIQYKDFALWQNSRFQRETTANQAAYWNDEFSTQREIPVLQLPIDYPRPAVQSFEGGSFDFRLSMEESRGLRALAMETGSTLFMVLLSLVTIWLSKLSGQEDILIGTPIAGRRHADLEKVIGIFVNTLIMRNYPVSHMTVREFVQEVTERTLSAFENQEYPFEDLVERLPVERDTGRNPLFDVMLNLLNHADYTGDLKGTDETGIQTYTHRNAPTKFDLTLTAIDMGEQVVFIIDYCRKLFKPATVERMISYFRRLAVLSAGNPNRLLPELEIISPAQRERIYHSINEIQISPQQSGTDTQLPASFHQERLWFIDKFERGYLYESGPVYHNIPLILKIAGPVHCSHLEQCIRAVLQRHDVLRTNVITVAEKPFQLIRPEVEFHLKVADLNDSGESGNDGSNRLDEALALAVKETQRPFKLDRDLLMRGTLIRIHGKSSLLVITLHHIIADRASLGILAREILLHYRALGEKETPQLPQPPLHYTHFSQWQHRLPREITDYWMSYWKRELQGKLQPMELAADRPRAAVHIYHGQRQTIILTQALNRELKRFIRDKQTSQKVSQKVILLAVFKMLLYRYTGHDEIVLGHSFPNRLQQETQRIIGPLANLTVLRSDLSGPKTFNTLLDYLDHKLKNAGKYRGMPFDKLVSELNPDKDMSRTALFDILFQYEDDPFQLPRLKDLRMETVETNLGWGKYDLNLSFIKKKDSVSGILVYNGDYYNDSTISRMIRHYLTLLDSALETPGLPISTYAFLTEEEKHQILVQFNDTRADYPANKTIPQLFEEKVRKYPHRSAVEYEGETLSYEQLNQRSHQLARQLLEKGIRPDTPVALLVKPSLEMLIGIFGILKSGGAYLPIDPDYPQDRIDYMLMDSGAGVLVSRLDGLSVKRLDASSEPTVKPSNQRNKTIKPSNLAYIIYTSGTTGRPKGVMIEHKNVVRLLFNSKCPFDFTANDTWTLFHSYSFDFSVWEIFGALLYGGRLIVIPKTVARDRETYLELLKTRKVTVLNQTPAAFYHLSDIEVEVPTGNNELTLRYVIFGGEALHPAKLKAWKEKYPETKLVNMYGITETTVHVTYKEITMREIRQNISNIGVPLPTLTTYVVDRNQQLLPVGVPGELVVGGDGVARGYLGKPRLTQRKFIANPYKAGDIMYRSGDLVKLLENGELEYLGRIDDQVKIRGYRIELGEIQVRLKTHRDIKEAAVVVRGKEKEESSLCAYIVSLREPDVPELRGYLAQKLPDYMIPSYFVRIQRIPLTPNGKIDRKALPDPEFKATDDYVAPTNSLEAQLVKPWSEILGIDPSIIGIDDNFFQLGGHSLKATVMASKIHRVSNVKVPLTEIFQAPTIRQLARYIDSADRERFAAIEAVEKQEYYLLSSAQKRLYIIQQMDLKGIAYNMPQSISLENTTPLEKLQAVFINLIHRHESFRTSFHMIDNQPVQRVHDHVEFAIEYFGRGGSLCPPLHGDHSGISNDNKSQRDFIRPFDLSRAPLLRVGLAETGEGNPLLMVDMHHIISDGVSMALLKKDFTALYEGRSLPPLRIQYRDFTQWQNSALEKENIKRQETYWLKEFDGQIPVLELPTDYPRPAIQHFDGGAFEFDLSSDETRALKTTALENNSTLFMVVLSVTCIWLSRLSGQEAIVIGTPVAGRGHDDLEKIIGMFVNTLALENNPAGDIPVGTFLRHVKDRTLAAFENRDYPFEELVEKVAVGRDAARNPIFDVLFTLDAGETTHDTHHQPGANPITGDQPPGNISKFDLTLNGIENHHRLHFSIQYGAKLFKPESIQRFAGYFKRVAASITPLSALTMKLRQIEIIPPEEKKQILADFNDTGSGYPRNYTIHRLFEERAAKHPHRAALVYEDGFLTYR
ncbi:MAG: amino acid adenylation domain-containing protein, partial [bacterium]|nr:amino acid adenylation domain-containing protein [bacterium]